MKKNHKKKRKGKSRKFGRKKNARKGNRSKNIEPEESERIRMIELKMGIPQKIVFVERKTSNERKPSERSYKPKKKKKGKKLRAPVVVVLGHVDSGKTLLLDCVRKTNTQKKEAGGITQQMGTTFVDTETISRISNLILKKRRGIKLQVPGLCFIDTPGHFSFENLRRRGSCVCDLAILVIDIMKGIQPQTVESIRRLRSLGVPFIIALNKIDRLNFYSSSKKCEGIPIEEVLQSQETHTLSHYYKLFQELNYGLQSHGINSKEYFRNDKFQEYVSIVPISAKTGDGIADLLLLLTQLSQKYMKKKLVSTKKKKKKMSKEEEEEEEIYGGEGSVLENMFVEGIGTTIDVLITSGCIQQRDFIVIKKNIISVRGARVRSILTPKGKNKELRSGDGSSSSSSSSHDFYLQHKRAGRGQCVRISGHKMNEFGVGIRVLFVRKSRKNELEKLLNRRMSEKEEESKDDDHESREMKCIRKESKDAMLQSIRRKQKEYLSINNNKKKNQTNNKIKNNGYYNYYEQQQQQEEEEEVVSEVYRKNEERKIGVSVLCNSKGTLQALLDSLRRIEVPVRYSRVTHKASLKDLKICGMTPTPIINKNSSGESNNNERNASVEKDNYRVLILFFTQIMTDGDLVSEANRMGIKVIYGEILYQLLNEVQNHFLSEKKRRRMAYLNKDEICWPVKLRILKDHVFRASKPFVFGVEVVSCDLKLGTRLCVVRRYNNNSRCRCVIVLGVCRQIKDKNSKDIEIAREGDVVSVCIEGSKNDVAKVEAECVCGNCCWGAGMSSVRKNNISYGRHFDHDDLIVSNLDRPAIDLLKDLYSEELLNNRKLLTLICELKNMLSIV